MNSFETNPGQAFGVQRRSLLKVMASAGALGAVGGVTGCAQLAGVAPLDEDSAYALALEAYVYAYPLEYFARLRHLRLTAPDPVAKVRAQWGEWLHRSVVVTPDVPGAPQTDTLYSNVWLDLSMYGEPVVLTIPKMDGRYWSIQCSDFMGTTFGLPSRRSMPEGGAVAIVGPGWSGTLPAGVKPLRTDVAQTLSLLRLFFSSPEDRLKAIEFQRGFKIAPLSSYLHGQTHVAGVDGNPFKPLAPKDDPLAGFKAMQQMWREALPPAVNDRYARLGLGAVESGFGHLSPEVVRGMERAEAQGRRLVTANAQNLPGNKSLNGWVAPKPSIGYYNDGDRLYRAAITLAGTVALPVSENPYYTLFKDGEGAQLNGDARYELHFTREQIPQVNAFWSLHAYTMAYKVIPNPLNRYALGDRSSMRYAADGSLTLYVQADDPGAEKNANWLPVRKGEAYWLIVRAYEPKGALQDLTWPGPTVTRKA